MKFNYLSQISVTETSGSGQGDGDLGPYNNRLTDSKHGKGACRSQLYSGIICLYLSVILNDIKLVEDR